MVELSMPLLEYHANRTIPAVGHENSDIYLNLCWKNMFNLCHFNIKKQTFFNLRAEIWHPNGGSGLYKIYIPCNK